MFTKNFYNAYVPIQLTNTSIPIAHVVPIADFSSYNTNTSVICNDAFDALMKDRVVDFAVDSTSADVNGLCFGTGNTPATIDDTTLSGDFIAPSNYTWSYTVTHNNDVKGATEFEAIYTITNTSGNDMTIGEVALCCYVSGRLSSGGSLKYCPFVIERTAFETPITIPAGGVGQVTYTLRFDWTTT